MATLRALQIGQALLALFLTAGYKGWLLLTY